MLPIKIPVRLCECAGSSKSSLGAHVFRYDFGRCGRSHVAVYIRLGFYCQHVSALMYIPFQTWFQRKWIHTQGKKTYVEIATSQLLRGYMYSEKKKDLALKEALTFKGFKYKGKALSDKSVSF